MPKRPPMKGISAAAALEFRSRLMEKLNRISSNWVDLSDEELSKLLIPQGITTATGKRFSPERVREFRRALSKAAASDDYHSWQDGAGTADAVRRALLAIISELTAPVSAERHAKLAETLTRCALILMEDRFAGQTALLRATAVAERSLARRIVRQG